MIFSPRFTAGSVTTTPHVVGQLVAGADGQLRVDHVGGSTLYAGVTVVNSMAELLAIAKSTHRLYCLGSDLYRWDGTTILQVSGSDTFLAEGEYDCQTRQWSMTARRYDENGQPTAVIVPLNAVIRW